MKKIVCFIFVLFAVKTFSQEIILPDQVFTIKVTEKNTSGKTESMPMDELVMKSNQLSAAFSIKNGFPAVAYTVNQEAAPNTYLLIFTAEAANSKKHILKWSGTINGKVITGKAERFVNGQAQGEYTFTGTLKKKK